MRNILLVLLLSSIGTYALAQNSKSFTLQEAINYALDNSLSIKNSKIGITDAEERIKENRALGLPTVNLNLGYTYTFELQDFIIQKGLFQGMPVEGEFEKIPPLGALNHRAAATIDVQSLVFDWSYLKALEAARAYRNFSSEQVLQSEQEVRNQVRTAYLPSLILEEMKKTISKNISNLEKLLFETKEIYKAGFAEQLDVDRLELSLANLKTEQENLERQKQISFNALKMVMNYPINQSISVTDDIEQLLSEASTSTEELEGDINFSNRQEYKVALLGQSLNQLNIDYIKATYYPNLVGFAQYQQVGQSLDFLKNNIWTDQGLIGFQANIPIYSGGAKKAKLQRAKLEFEKTSNDIKALERVIWMEVGNARIAHQSAKIRVASQEKNLALAQRIYDTTQIKYREGIGSSLEITSAEQSLFQSQQNLIQARYELLQAKMELDIALGK